MHGGRIVQQLSEGKNRKALSWGPPRERGSVSGRYEIAEPNSEE